MPGGGMAIEESDRCREHPDRRVSLFCISCEVLLCARCVSQGPSNVTQHRTHLYLDLTDAFHIQKDDISKIISAIKDSLSQKKRSRQHAQSRLQKMEFELLRKRSAVERRKRSLIDRVSHGEADFLSRLEQVASPTVRREQQACKDLEYDVVTREGLLATLEALNRMREEDGATFIENMVRVKKEVEEMLAKDLEATQKPPKDVEEERSEIRQITVALHGEKKAIGRAFKFPIEPPCRPRILPSLSVTSSTSVCLVWKHPKATDKVDKFRVKFKPRNGCCHPTSFLPPHGGTTKYEDQYQVISVRYNTGRVMAILRELTPSTEYEVKICAVNDKGEGEAATAVVHTRDWEDYMFSQGRIWLQREAHRDSIPKMFIKICFHLCAFVITAVFMCLVFGAVVDTYRREWCRQLHPNLQHEIPESLCPIEYLTSQSDDSQDTEGEQPDDGDIYEFENIDHYENIDPFDTIMRTVKCMSRLIYSNFSELYQNITGVIGQTWSIVYSLLSDTWLAFIELVIGSRHREDPLLLGEDTSKIDPLLLGEDTSKVDPLLLGEDTSKQEPTSLNGPDPELPATVSSKDEEKVTLREKTDVTSYYIHHPMVQVTVPVTFISIIVGFVVKYGVYARLF